MQPFEKQYQQLVSIIDRIEELDSVTKRNGREIEAEWWALDKDLNDVARQIKFLTEPYTPERFTTLINKGRKYLESIRVSWGIRNKESIYREFGPVDDDMNWDS